MHYYRPRRQSGAGQDTGSAQTGRDREAIAELGSAADGGTGPANVTDWEHSLTAGRRLRIRFTDWMGREGIDLQVFRGGLF